MSMRRVSVTHGAMEDMPKGMQRRGGRYYLRRRTPLDLIEAHQGRKELVYSLGTADFAEAKRRHAIEWVRLDEQFRILRAQRKSLSRPSVIQAAPPSFADEPQEVFEDWLESDARENADMAREEAEYAARGGQRKLALDWLMGSRSDISPDQLAVRDLFQDQEFRLALSQERLMAVELARKVEEPIAAKPIAPTSAAGALKLTDIIDEWGRERGVRPKGLADHRAVAKWFEDRLGPLAISEIGRQHVIDFKNRLRDEGQSQANLKVKLSRLRTLLGYAMANGYRADNPAFGVTITVKDADKNKRKSFDPISLRKIFSSPVYIDGIRPAGGKGEAAYWLPLLGLYTGARLEELGQLRVSDVVSELYGDTDDLVLQASFLRITEDDNDGLKLKNAGSARLVPIHSVLVDCGFISYVQGVKSSGQSRFFPDLKPDKYGRFTAKWGEWFSTYRRDVCGLDDRRLVFHSFRHTFKDCCRHAGILEGVQRQLMGHSPGDVAGSYGAGYSLHQLVTAMNAYRIPGFTPPPPA